MPHSGSDNIHYTLVRLHTLGYIVTGSQESLCTVDDIYTLHSYDKGIIFNRPGAAFAPAQQFRSDRDAAARETSKT